MPGRAHESEGMGHAMPIRPVGDTARRDGPGSENRELFFREPLHAETASTSYDG